MLNWRCASKVDFVERGLVEAEQIWIRHLAGGDIRPPWECGLAAAGKAALRPVFKC